MGSMSLEGDTDKSAFRTALSNLKREGSSVLIVGTNHSAHAAVCQRLFEQTEADRYQILVATERAYCSDRYTNSDWYKSRYNTLIKQSAGVDTEETDVTGLGTEEPIVVDPTLLSLLGTAVIEAVDAYQNEAFDLEAGQVRLCVDSVAPLLVDHDPKSVFRLLHVLTTRISRVNGMGQYHLPLERDHDAVHLLAPLFDAVVEVRSADDGIEQRWHLRDQGTSSEWITLPSKLR